MKRSLPSILVLAGAIAAVGCTPSTGGDPPSDCAVTPAEAFDSPSRDTNAATALALRAQLDALVSDTMRAAEEGSATVDDLADLTGPYEAGDPSLADVTSAAWQDISSDAFGEFVDVIAAGAQDLVDDSGAFTPGAAGGLFGTDLRGVNEGGLEVRQLIDKGLFAGGALYPYAVSLTEGEITEATIDELSALWGGNATLDPAGELTDSANYSHRMGYHADIAGALTRARAYAADDACTAERDEAVVEFFRLWEESMFARFVYYANAAAEVSAAALTDDEYADAMHELAEGIGLGLGFYGVPEATKGPLAAGARVASDELIEAMADDLGVDLTALGSSTTGALVTDPAAFATAVEDLEATVAEALGLEASEVAAWREPTEG